MIEFHWNGGLPWTRIGRLEIWLWPLHFGWLRPNGFGAFSIKVWGVVCFTCNHFSLGCKRHWFCGMCERCAQQQEPDEEYT